MIKSKTSDPINLSSFFDCSEQDFIMTVRTNPLQYKEIICSQTGFGLIHIAVLRGIFKALEELVLYKFDVNLRARLTSFEIAGNEGQIDRLVTQFPHAKFRFYAEQKGPNIKLQEPTPLHLAVLTLNVQLVKQLIAAGANAKLRIQKGLNHFTPAHIIVKLSYYQAAPNPVLNELARFFSRFEHKGVDVSFNKEFQIKAVEINRRPEVYFSAIEEHPDAYDGDKLKPGYNVCHKISFASIRRSYAQQFIGLDPKIAAVNLNESLKAMHSSSIYPLSPTPEHFTHLDFVILCAKQFEALHGNNRDNFFIGPAVANGGINWLEERLFRDRRYTNITAENFRPLQIKIDSQFACFFAVSKRFTPYYNDINDSECLVVKTFTALTELRKLAEVDSPEVLPSYLTMENPMEHVSHAKAWLKNAIIELIDDHGAEGLFNYPLNIEIPRLYCEYFTSLPRLNDFIQGDAFHLTNKLLLQRLKNITGLTFYRASGLPREPRKHPIHEPAPSSFQRPPSPPPRPPSSVITLPEPKPLELPILPETAPIPAGSELALVSNNNSSLTLRPPEPFWNNRPPYVQKKRVKEKKPTKLELAAKKRGQQKMDVFFSKRKLEQDETSLPAKRIVPEGGVSTSNEILHLND